MTDPASRVSYPALLGRRQFLRNAGMGAGSLALASLLHAEGLLAAEPVAAVDPLAPKKPHFAPKAKSVIWLFMTGSPSQVDTFDYKPELQKRDGQTLAGADPKTGFFTTSGKCLKSPFEWKQHGQSGTWVSRRVPAPAEARRRHGVRPLVLHAGEQPRAGAIELVCGRHAAGAAEHGVVGDVRPRAARARTCRRSSSCTRPSRAATTPIWSAGFLPKTYQALALDARGKKPIANLDRAAGQTDAAAAGRSSTCSAR